MGDVCCAPPGEMVHVACDKCGRAGQYRKATLITRYGAELALPDLRHEIAKCDRRASMGDACGVHFVGLAAERFEYYGRSHRVPQSPRDRSWGETPI